MKKYILIFCFFIPAMIRAQDTISLDRCLRAAENNHPRKADYQMLRTISENKLANYQTNWYPELNLNGSATYQSDVISLNTDIPVPGFQFPTAPKDQYKLSLDISQTMYDAGMTKKKKELEEAGMRSSLKQLESDIAKEKDLIKDLYFGILSLQENLKITALSIQQLDTSKSIVRSGVENGVLLRSDLDLLNVEILKLEQNRTELESRREAMIAVLTDKTGISVSEGDSFLLTGFEIPASVTMKRPELEVFDLKKEVLGRSADLLRSKRLPVLYAFGQFGYGKPGLNMLNDQFDTWYVVGAGLKWNVWDWNQVKRSRENLTLQKEIAGNQKAYFVMNIHDALTQKMAEIGVHQENIEKFRHILSLREGITSTYYSQLKNGTIKTSDYIRVLTEEKIARIRLSTEEILLQKAVADYKYTEGTL